jgi:hypothetical protein
VNCGTIQRCDRTSHGSDCLIRFPRSTNRKRINESLVHARSFIRANAKRSPTENQSVEYANSVSGEYLPKMSSFSPRAIFFLVRGRRKRGPLPIRKHKVRTESLNCILARRQESRFLAQETPSAVRNLGRNSARSSGVNQTIHPQTTARAAVNKPMVAQRTIIGPGIM